MICLALLGVLVEDLFHVAVAAAVKFSEKSCLLTTHPLTKKTGSIFPVFPKIRICH